MRACQSCGSLSTDYDRFCLACGADLGAGAGPTPAESSRPADWAAAIARHWRLIALILGILLVVLIVAALWRAILIGVCCMGLLYAFVLLTSSAKTGSSKRRSKKSRPLWTSTRKVTVPSYRNRALKRYGDRCQMCGRRGAVEVHHTDLNRQNANISNLRVLCPECHRKVHVRLRRRGRPIW